MFAYSPVETENIFYNPKNSYNKEASSSTNRSKSLPSSSCNKNKNFDLLSVLSEGDQQRKRFEQAALKRDQLKQELQRRHQLCAENERLCRERAKKQIALKKVEECNALRKFYELKSAQLRSNSIPPLKTSGNVSSSSSSPSISSSSLLFSRKSSSLPSKSLGLTVQRFQAAYKIYTFIKHHIEKRNTLRIISNLKKLSSIKKRLIFLKSVNLKKNLTFDLNNNNNNGKVLPISADNKAFLVYKESILKILNQLDNEFTDENFLVKEREQNIKNTVNNILRDLEDERDLQYQNFIKKKKMSL